MDGVSINRLYMPAMDTGDDISSVPKLKHANVPYCTIESVMLKQKDVAVVSDKSSEIDDVDEMAEGPDHAKIPTGITFQQKSE